MAQPRVFIAAMNMRGERAQPPTSNCTKINVTSAQATASRDRKTFSPMQPIAGGYKGFYNFEAYWQSGKVWEHVSHAVSKDWWLSIDGPKRRLPNSRGKRVLHALFNDTEMDYITSRKQVYVPEYYALIENSQRLQELQQLHQSSIIVVYDFDGPRSPNNEPICLECTLDLLQQKINDTTHPFGHGYIVAAAILGIAPTQYTM